MKGFFIPEANRPLQWNFAAILRDLFIKDLSAGKEQYE
jgi:hypothetical protein